MRGADGVDQTVASGGDVAVDSPSPPPRREQSVNIAEDLGAAGRNLTEPRVKPVNHMRRRKEEKIWRCSVTRACVPVARMASDFFF
jgi:hypothetical protein